MNTNFNSDLNLNLNLAVFLWTVHQSCRNCFGALLKVVLHATKKILSFSFKHFNRNRWKFGWWSWSQYRNEASNQKYLQETLNKKRIRKAWKQGNLNIFQVFRFSVCFRETHAFHLSSFHGINLNNFFSLVAASEQSIGRRSSIRGCGRYKVIKFGRPTKLAILLISLIVGRSNLIKRYCYI